MTVTRIFKNDTVYGFYCTYILADLLRIRLYGDVTKETQLVCDMIKDAMENVMSNHALFYKDSINFLNNVDKKLDSWVNLVPSPTKEKLVNLVYLFLESYYNDFNNKEE